MLVEHFDSPLAIGTRKPRFSWSFNVLGRNKFQSAYRILVATTPKFCTEGHADIWDSGKVTSRQSTQIEYEGIQLESNQTYFWSLQTWDEKDEASEVSPLESFGTGLLDDNDWKAKWIGMGPTDEDISHPQDYTTRRLSPEAEAVEPDLRSPMLRKSFSLQKPIKRARVFVCGLGLYELRLNGKKVGDDLLATPRTEFRETVFYSTHDITQELTQKENAFGLLLGNGWFNGHKKYWGWQMQWYGSPRAIVQTEIDYDDGSHETIISDESWKGDWSEITFNNIYDGEHVDARLQQKHWDSPNFDDKNWSSVNEVSEPGGKLKALNHEQERCTDTIESLAIHEPRKSVYVIDTGVNMTGWLKLKIRNSQKGDVVKIHYGEAIHENLELNAASNNAALQCDEYICSGEAEENFEPRFTFHGFQFAEIQGLRQQPNDGDIEACFVRNSVKNSGSFECDHALINKIHRCTLQSQLCNIQMGVPTDDTQRPERLGWGADAWAVAQELLYNCSGAKLFEKWIGDYRDQQDETGVVSSITPRAGIEEDIVWSAAFVLVPWWVYQHCGNIRILEENYDSLKKYLDYLQKVGIKEIGQVPMSDILNPLFDPYDKEKRFPKESERGFLQRSQWGDHLATAEGAATRSAMPLSISTAFYYADVTTMAKVAQTLVKTDDAKAYHNLASNIKQAFNDRFYEPAMGYYDTGVQSAQAWPLTFGLTTEENHESVSAYYLRCIEDKQRHLTTGYAGTKFAIHALANLDRHDLIYKMATATDYPSWGFMLRLGRTTACEQWNGERGSLNHAPLSAAIDEWFYSGLAGIQSDPQAPGFENTLFKPHIPKDLSWARASIETDRGLVSSHWLVEGQTVQLKVTVPGNSTSLVEIPWEDADAISEGSVQAKSAEGVEWLESKEGKSVFKTGSGNYTFRWKLS